ncbi:MAG TPA: MaoC family dehydratase [Chondromyces sp.]|nr:MaoC family dehydratase [Chondromyces sp.]
MAIDGRLDGYSFEDLEEGMSAVISKTVTEADIVLYAGISMDTNPLHLDEAYASGSRFGGRIAHGMLGAGLISALLGTKLPGPGAIYVSQSLRFKAPVRIGDTLVAEVTVTGLDPGKNRARFATRVHVGETLVIDGEAELLMPSRT